MMTTAIPTFNQAGKTQLTMDLMFEYVRQANMSDIELAELACRIPYAQVEFYEEPEPLTLDKQVENIMAATPAYHLPDGNVIYLREELLINPPVDVDKGNFSKRLLIWEPDDLLEYICDGNIYMPVDYAYEADWHSYLIGVDPANIMEWQQEYNLPPDIEPPEPTFLESYQFRLYQLVTSGEVRCVDNDFWASSNLPSSDDEMAMPTCPICEHYDDNKPLFRNCPKMG